MTPKRITFVLAACLAALAAAAAATAKSNDTKLTGAGSSFVFPLVSAWTPALGHAFGYDLTYGSIGSGAGIAAITNRTVDFGASDAPLTPDQAEACKGCVQIPWALSATSIAYNVPGAPAHLKLNGQVLANIFLGQIEKWNDPAIAKLNKGSSLPDLKITPVYRSDGSGTSYNFTDYLGHVSPAWKSKVGVGTQVSFPTGIGARGSSGVAGVVQRTEAAKSVTLPQLGADNAGSIVNPGKKFAKAYPICTFTYVIVPTQSSKAAELRKMLFWAVTQGQKPQYTAKLLFAPLPKPALVAAERTIKKIRSV
jgi:phosphate transport system substrate-binding protein